MVLDVLCQQVLGKPNDAQRRMVGRGPPVLQPNGYPDSPGQLIGQAMEGERRGQADDALGRALGGQGQFMLTVDRCVGELVETPTEPHDLAGLDHPANGGRSYTRRPQFGCAHQSAFPKQAFSLGGERLIESETWYVSLELASFHPRFCTVNDACRQSASLIGPREAKIALALKLLGRG